MNAILKITEVLPTKVLVPSIIVTISLLTGALFFVVTRGETMVSTTLPPQPIISLDARTLTAQAAVVYDPETRHVLFAKNEEEQLPLASITKLMTAAAVLQQENADARIYITSDALKTPGDSGLHAGEEWSLRDLIKYGLLVSSNDAMAAVAESVGREKTLEDMNAVAKSLGLTQSYFLDPTGLDLTDGVAGAYGSALDVAILTGHFLQTYPSFFESTVKPGAVGRKPQDKATATPLFDIPGLIGAKTGYTDLAGGNLVVAFDAGLSHPLIAVVLRSTEEGRFEDIRTLINASRQAELSQ